METQGVKRSAPESTEILEDVKAIILGLEGTTALPSFVQELLTYIRSNVKTHLESKYEEEECQEDIKSLREQATTDKEEADESCVEIVESEYKNAVIESVVANVSWQMDNDRQSAALSKFQAHILRDGYKSEALQGKIFEDVAPAVREWVSEKRKVYVFSSGSSEAQQLLFSNSSFGNLGDLFSGHFDTVTGTKKAKESYAKIAQELSLDPTEILFLTNNPAEAGSAAEAGLKTSLVARDDSSLTDDDKQSFNVIDTLAELTSAANGTAKKVETEEAKADVEVPASEEKEATEEAPAKEAEATEEQEPSVQEGTPDSSEEQEPSVQEGTPDSSEEQEPSVQEGTPDSSEEQEPSVQEGTPDSSEVQEPSVQEGTPDSS